MESQGYVPEMNIVYVQYTLIKKKKTVDFSIYSLGHLRATPLVSLTYSMLQKNLHHTSQFYKHNNEIISCFKIKIRNKIFYENILFT